MGYSRGDKGPSVGLSPHGYHEHSCPIRGENGEEIAKIAHEHNIIFILDGAQSTPHIKVDVKDIDCDFYVFSAHKLGGPTGIGALYGKEVHLANTDPYNLGGGMNKKFAKDIIFVLSVIDSFID